MNLSIRGLCGAIGSVGLSLVLVGCTTTPVQVTPQKVAQDAVPVVAERSADAEYSVELPDVEMTPEILYQLLVAETALQRGHYAMGMVQYYRLAQKTRDPRLAAKATRIAVFVRDRQAALQAAQLWVEIDPVNLMARQAVSAAYIRNGNPDAALEHLEYVLAQEDDGTERGFMLVASLLSREQDLQSALKVMEHLVESREQSDAAWYAYAQLALRAKMVEKADAGVKRSLHLKPENTNAVLLQARIMRLKGDKEAAVDYLGQQVKSFPAETVLRLTYARQLVDVRDYEAAYTQYKIVIKQTPDDVDVLFALGLLALQLGEQESAYEYLSQANETGRRVDDARFYLGQLEELRENLDAAMVHYSFVERGDNLVESRVRQAMIAAQLGDVDKARDYLHSLHLTAPAQRQRIFLIEGEILRNAERHQEEMVLYNHALSEMAGSVPLLYARALAAERLNQLDVTERDLKQILDADADNIDALNALGYTLADRTDRYQEAYAYIKRALELRPNDNAILDSMGWVLYRLGQYNEAIKMLRKSLEISLDPEVAAHLGEVLWVNGEREDAREIWTQALEISPGDKRLLNIMEQFIKK